MNGDVHVRFCESQGLQCPWPLAKAKALTRAQKLARALKVCRKTQSKTKRAKCERQARKKYGPVKARKKGRR